MINISFRRVDRKSNTPILSDKEIDEMAHAILEDYKPKLLKEPGAIRFEHFLEYLGAELTYKDIYTDDPDRPILGATSFNDGEVLKVFNREDMCVSPFRLDAGMIAIDTSVMEKGKEGFALFTGLHEGGHFIIHPGAFSRDPNQMSLEDFMGGTLEPQIICCRRESIENFDRPRKLVTPHDFREHHADYFAAAIAMPNATFFPVVRILFKELGIRNERIVLNLNYGEDYIAKKVLPERISQIYGVSKKAAFIKLKKSDFVTDKKTYAAECVQYVLEL